MVPKKDIDWGSLGFAYTVTDKRYVDMFYVRRQDRYERGCRCPAVFPVRI